MLLLLGVATVRITPGLQFIQFYRNDLTLLDPKTRMSFILPPKYVGKFSGGGVLLQMKESEIDFIQIHALP